MIHNAHAARMPLLIMLISETAGRHKKQEQEDEYRCNIKTASGKTHADNAWQLMIVFNSKSLFSE